MRGDRIRLAREQLRYTQEDLAEKLEIAVLQINRYENNKTTPSGDIVRKLAEVLHVSSDYLLGLTDEPTPAHLDESLKPRERAALSAWRRGDRFEAIKVIVEDE